jgi:hypothetical protein
VEAANQWDQIARPQTGKPKKTDFGLDDDLDDMLDDVEDAKGIESTKPPVMTRAKTANPTRH